MKTLTLITIAFSVLVLFSCGNSDTKTNENNNKSEQVNTTNEEPDLTKQEDFEKMLSGYGISLYPDIVLKKIKTNSNDEIVATYNVSDMSAESKQKINDYISNELLKLKNAGWGVEETLKIAMKKENNYKVGIQINQSYAPDLKLHTIIYSYSKVY